MSPYRSQLPNETFSWLWVAAIGLREGNSLVVGPARLPTPPALLGQARVLSTARWPIGVLQADCGRSPFLKDKDYTGLSHKCQAMWYGEA